MDPADLTVADGENAAQGPDPLTDVAQPDAVVACTKVHALAVILIEQDEMPVVPQ